MLTERSIINFLIWTGGLIVGPYLAVSAVENNFTPCLVVAGVCFVVVIFGFLRDRICLLPLVGAFFAGRLNFLPLRPAPSDFCALAVIAYYLITYVALQRKKIQTGPLIFFLPILTIGLIVLFHEHNFGLRSMGTGREGGRGAIFVLVAVVTYLFGVSISSPSPRFLRWTPLYCIGAVIISAIPYAITTYWPRTAPLFFFFTDNINGSAYTADVLEVGDIVRNRGQADVGAAVVTFLLAYFPIYTWWRPHRWWVAITALICIVLVIMGGFRSTVVVFGLTSMVAMWCYSSWRVLFLIPPLALVVFLGVAMQDTHVVQLPISVQRSLSFLPGDWDPEIIENTTSSDDFRQRIQDVYLREEARKSPLLGNGLSYNSAEFAALDYLARRHETADNYYLSKEFIVSKQFHTGWISLYDAVGLVGFAAFLVVTLSLIWFSGRMVFRKGVDRGSSLFPLKVWMFCNLLPSFVGYFVVYGDFKTAFPGFCYYAILWTHLNRIEKYGYRAKVPVRGVPFDPARTEISVPA